jgi:uroporphyrinogen decarboxylase
VVPGNGALMEALARVRAALDPETALIGFAGAPFTLAAYMIDGRGGGEFPRTRALMAEDPALLDRLLETLSRGVAALLIGEIEAGAQAVQLFDSWAGLLEGEAFTRWSAQPARAIVAEVKRAHPAVPFVGFPRGAGVAYGRYREATGVDVLQIDQSVSLEAMAALQKGGPVQGNLDPELLLAGGAPMRAAATAILDAMADGPHVFNLGHGVIKETPPDHVADLVATVRAHKRGGSQ